MKNPFWVLTGAILVVLIVLQILPVINTGNARSLLEGQGYVVFAAGEYTSLNAKIDALQVIVEANAIRLEANADKIELNTALINSATGNATAANNAAVIAANNAILANDAAVIAAGNASVAVIAAQAANNAAVIAATKIDLFNSAPVYLFPGNSTTVVTLECGDTVDGLAGTWSQWREVKDGGNVTLSSKFAAAAGYISDMPIFYSSAPTNVYTVELSYGGSYTTLGKIAFNSSTTNYSGTIAQIKSRHVPAGQTIYYRAWCDSSCGIQVLL